MGAWIEINLLAGVKVAEEVAPHVGAWIEILRAPTRKRLLEVAPHVGAWIEILPIRPHLLKM